MTCDVYYAAYTSPQSTTVTTLPSQDEFGTPISIPTGGVGQNEYGESVKVWGMDRTETNSYWNVMGTVNLQDLKADTQFQYKKRLNGRFMGNNDPRIDSLGKYHDISDMLITNIRDKNTGNRLHINEDGSDIIFEVMSVDPFINPWNEIEYYKVLLERADDQEIM